MDNFTIICIMFTVIFFVPPIFIPSHISLLHVMQWFTRSKWISLFHFHIFSHHHGRTVVTSSLSSCVCHPVVPSSAAERRGVYHRHLGSSRWARDTTWRRLYEYSHWDQAVAHSFELPSRDSAARSLSSVGTTCKFTDDCQISTSTSSDNTPRDLFFFPIASDLALLSLPAARARCMTETISPHWQKERVRQQWFHYFFGGFFSQWNKQRVNLNGVSHRSECFKLCKDYKS